MPGGDRTRSTLEGNLKNAGESDVAEKNASDETIAISKASCNKMDKSQKDVPTSMDYPVISFYLFGVVLRGWTILLVLF